MNRRHQPRWSRGRPIRSGDADVEALTAATAKGVEILDVGDPTRPVVPTSKAEEDRHGARDIATGA
jgi:hypothetical protein